ncbi:hypothetical protein SADUNF_Sadunf15G0095600 [Salix dunnii]|uniref:DUF4220 domain-containing protein n=1 Tax=Salix dunnii TaxID=1413687 RepID=A0A835MIU6_9ROSI|nr:hypothetical protein SADUNF_Sadunf15G0095600 [Salix dunnii]
MSHIKYYLQTILIIFGPLRKTIAIVWIRILIWSASLSADMVATFALGNLARSQRDSSGDGSKKANNSIQSLWAPFLLLHLGGPDTITAYSIEDNELWLRHLLGLVVQVGVAFYVFSRSWGNGILPFIAIPMFIVGIIKYSERTWVLWSSCSKSLRNSSLLGFWTSFLRTTKPESDQQREYLRQAYTFFHISKFTMQDLVPTSMYLMLSHLRFSEIPADIALKVVEVELGLIYDMLYTKAPLIYSISGIILRCISFLLYITAFIIFQVKIEKHAYSSIDVAITYLLFVAAAFLELYALLCLVFSDHTLIWLVDKGGNAWASAIYSWVRKSTTSKRWSRSISQYSLATICTENKPRKCLELVGIDEMMRQMNVNRKDLNGGLHEFIFKHLQKKAKEENLNLLDKKIRSKITGQRGDGVLERMGVLQNYKWCTIELEFSQSILVWHLATEICYLDNTSVQKDASNEKDDASNVSRSKCLSDYMMYLLVIRPNMLSIGFGEKEYKHTLIMLSDKITTQNSINTDYTAVNHGFMLAKQLLESTLEKHSAVEGGPVLAKQLESILESKKRWEMIEEVWMEMLTYAAAHCPWKEHAHALRRGGELLTHVCFLMLHLRFSQQYEFKLSDDIVFQAYKYLLEVRPFGGAIGYATSNGGNEGGGGSGIGGGSDRSGGEPSFGNGDGNGRSDNTIPAQAALTQY